MSSIPLTLTAIESYIGGGRSNACHAIKYIHVQYDIERNLANIEAHIPASTTNQGDYKISVQLETGRGSIRRASWNCPIGHKCKHIYKVLHRIEKSNQYLIPGPSEQVTEQDARRQRLAD